MALVTQFGGLICRKDAGNGPYNAGTRVYYHPATDANPLYIGDPIIISGSGDANGTPSATLATAGTGNRITGVVTAPAVSASSVPNGYLSYLPASTAGYVLAEDDPGCLYEVQEDGIGGLLTVDSIGLNCNLINGTGNMYGSGWLLDSSTAATTAGLQVRIIGFAQGPDNTVGGTTLPNGDVKPPRWLVRLNQSTETGAAGSTGI